MLPWTWEEGGNCGVPAPPAGSPPAKPSCSWRQGQPGLSTLLIPGVAGRGRRKRGEIQLPLHGKAGRLLPRGIHPALAAGEEQGHRGSLEEQLHQHDRRLQHVPAPAFPPAFPLALGPAPPPPAEPGTMRDWRGARAGGSPAAPTHPPQTHTGVLGSPQGCPVQLGRVVTSRPFLPWLRAGERGPPSAWEAAGKASPLLSFPTSGKAPAWPLPTPPPPPPSPGGTGPPSQPCTGTHAAEKGAKVEPGWWDAPRRERDAAGHPAPVTPIFPPAPWPHSRAGNEAKVGGR